MGVVADLINDGGGSQDGDGRAVAHRAGHPFVVLARLWHRERHGDEPGADRTQEADDVIQTLRSQDHRALTG